MKKAICFMPPLLMILAFMKGDFIISQYLMIFPLLLVLAGLLLIKNYPVKGMILGLIPSVDLFYMSLQNNISSGKILGVAFIIFYVIEGFLIYKKNKEKEKKNIE